MDKANKMSTITVTFCDCAENHVGMEKIGDMTDRGFSLDELKAFRKAFCKLGIDTSLHHIPLAEADEKAYVLVARNAVSKITSRELEEELKALDWDSKAKMRGRVVNKLARHNLCFSSYDQEPDYDRGKGRIVSFDSLPALNDIKIFLDGITGDNLVAEGNYYYDVSSCGIGYHGDSERRKVIGVRLGFSMPLVWQWYYRSEPVGIKYYLDINDGDIYIMSDKAVGYDWKKKIVYTLRHAAGCNKYTGLADD